MAKTNVEPDTGMDELLRELRAIPAGTVLTKEQVLAYLRRMPPMPPDFTTADAIRELRGPLPEDDPEYQRNILGRR